MSDSENNGRDRKAIPNWAMSEGWPQLLGRVETYCQGIQETMGELQAKLLTKTRLEPGETAVLKSVLGEGRPGLPRPGCPDGGACHHACPVTCFRSQHCLPLTSSGMTDDWQPGDAVLSFCDKGERGGYPSLAFADLRALAAHAVGKPSTQPPEAEPEPQRDGFENDWSKVIADLRARNERATMALRAALAIFDWMERRSIYQDADVMVAHSHVRAALGERDAGASQRDQPQGQ